MDGLLASERHLTGTITVVTSEGGTEECSFEIHSVFDPETGQTVVTGEVCGNPIGGDEMG